MSAFPRLPESRFLYRVNPKGKIHFAWGYSEGYMGQPITQIRVANSCNILGLEVPQEDWREGVVKIDADEWSDAVREGRVCAKCLDDLDRYYSREFPIMAVGLMAINYEGDE